VTTIYRAEVVGSLQRPAYLVDAIKKRNADEISIAEFKRIEDRAVDDAIDLQEQVGVDVVTDGEQRRWHFRDWLVRAVDGLSAVQAPAVRLRGLSGQEDLQRRDPLTVTDKLTFKRSVASEEFAYARGKTSKPLKVTLPHPFIYHLMYGPETKEVYPDPFELFYDAALLVKRECEELAALGCEYIQIDAPVVTLPLDSDAETLFAPLGVDLERFLEEAVSAMDIVADVPGVHFAAHYCRGNAPTHYFSNGSYDKAAQTLFQGSQKITTYLLEWDDWRAGSFEALRHVPHDKVVVLGFVSSMKHSKIESVEELVERVEEASRFFPKEQMALSPQCGFCSMVGLEGFDGSVQRAKLEVVVEAAHRIWG
jgi:5-methyltetrahydropteroyltriglutamate--homocysteine methyltransferase